MKTFNDYLEMANGGKIVSSDMRTRKRSISHDKDEEKLVNEIANKVENLGIDPNANEAEILDMIDDAIGSHPNKDIIKRKVLKKIVG